jgi:tetratricopeptide (TPR) repeat protein
MRSHRPYLVVLACLIVLRVYSYAGHSGQSVVSLYNQARFLADENRYEEAIKLLDQAIGLDPTFSRAFTSRGYCKTQKTPPDYAGALADFSKAVELAPDSAEAYVLRGEILFRQKSFKAALADFEKGAGLDSSYPRVFYDRGLARVQVGDLAGALSDLNKQVELDSADVWAYIGRADIRRAMGDVPGELADLNKAVQVDPKCAQAYKDRGALQTKLARLAEAKKDFEQAAALEPNNPAHQKDLADIERKLVAGPSAGTGGGASGGTGGATDAGTGPGTGPAAASDQTAIAQDLLSTFSRRLVYLDRKDEADPSLYRAIFEDYSGEFLEVELIWDKAAKSFDVSGMSAISHGKDAQALQGIIQGLRIK